MIYHCKVRIISICLFFFFQLNCIAAENLKHPGSNKCYVVPIEFFEDAPVLTVKIGEKKAKLVFDTGASIPLSLAKSIIDSVGGIKYTGEQHRSIDSAGKISSSATFFVEKVTLGEYHAKKVKGKDYKPWGMYVTESGKTEHKSKTEDHGVIGLGFFKNKNFIIDYSRKKIFILEGNAVPPDYKDVSWHSTPLILSKEGLIIQTKVNNHAAAFLLDTGSTGSMLRTTKILSQKNSENNSILAETFLISGKNYGPIKFFLLNFPKFSFDGLLGYDFFLKNVVYIDFDKKLVHFSAGDGGRLVGITR